jgi:hypothetical protein
MHFFYKKLIVFSMCISLQCLLLSRSLDFLHSCTFLCTSLLKPSCPAHRCTFHDSTFYCIASHSLGFLFSCLLALLLSCLHVAALVCTSPLKPLCPAHRCTLYYNAFCSLDLLFSCFSYSLVLFCALCCLRCVNGHIIL